MKRDEPYPMATARAIVLSSLAFIAVAIFLASFDGWPRFIALVLGLWGVTGVVIGALGALNAKRQE